MNALRWALLMTGFAAAAAQAQTNAAAGATTAAALWQAYRDAPDTQPNIPNCSYAGYRAGERPLPDPPVVANVRDFGATGNGQTNDTAAFEAALEKAGRSGGGAVLVPAGTYVLTNVLRLVRSGVVLRGEGPDRSILAFDRSLSDILGRTGRGSSRWSWMGGLVWIGPAETFGNDGRLAEGYQEGWSEGEPRADVTQPARRGDSSIEVAPANAAAFRPGQLALLCWTDPADRSLLQHIGGHPAMEKANWGALAGSTLRWPVEIAAVQGGRVRLKQPLRLDVRPTWSVHLATPNAFVQEVGVERLTLRMPAHRQAAHLQDRGFNGVYFNRAVQCWARDLVLENVDCGIVHAAAKNTTVTGLKIIGGGNHHATALREQSADNLIEDFRIESRPYHGINTECFSSGNVWHDGTMLHGTFDSHRALSFEFLRTNITLTNDGRPGGAGDAGPFVGARVAHWNIRVTGRQAGWVFQPSCLSMGALVGIQGVALDPHDGWAMPPGDKGTLVADPGLAPEPADLYLAQLSLRTGKPAKPSP